LGAGSCHAVTDQPAQEAVAASLRQGKAQGRILSEVMNGLTFPEIRDTAFRLYEQKAYAEALELMTQAAQRFPEEASAIYYWRMCLTARLNDVPGALKLFEEALTAGYWYAADLLRSDPDLAPVNNNPDFGRMLMVCRERAAEAQATAKPERIVLMPDTQAEPFPLLIALHGNNANAKLHQNLWSPAVKRGWLVALPQSSQASGPDRYVWNDQDWAKKEIQAHFADICQAYSINPKRVVLGGFSMGAETALRLALSGALPAQAVVAVAQGGPLTQQPDQWLSVLKADHKPYCYLIAGDQDRACAGTRSLAELLKEHGIPHTLDIYSGMSHTFPSDFEHKLGSILELAIPNQDN
jgi:dienelactone hydrolase